MRGVRGDKQVFDGPYGYAQSFFDGRYHSHELTDDLGTRYETDRVSLKPWPSIRLLHIGITALSDLMRDNKLSFDDVDHVTVSVGKLNLARCHPVEPGMVPVRRIDLLHNLPFALGATLKLGGPTLALYQDAKLADDVIVNAVPKIRWVYDASLDGPWTLEPARMELVTTTGRKFTGACDTALGHPDRPMSLEQRHRKFYEGAASAARPLSEEHARKIIDAVESLENMRNISTLADLLA
jgi:2-methylcitrate dehydratase PrpD